MDRKKQKNIIIIMSVLVICLVPLVSFAQFCAVHSYTVVSFNDGIVGFGCSRCGDYFCDDFESYYNLRSSDENYIAALDVVRDRVINAKDFAKLKEEYPSEKPTDPEITVSTTASTTATTSTTTTKPSTTKPSTVPATDPDGWNNEILKP